MVPHRPPFLQADTAFSLGRTFSCPVYALLLKKKHTQIIKCQNLSNYTYHCTNSEVSFSHIPGVLQQNVYTVFWFRSACDVSLGTLCISLGRAACYRDIERTVLSVFCDKQVDLSCIPQLKLQCQFDLLTHQKEEPVLSAGCQTCNGWQCCGK